MQREKMTGTIRTPRMAATAAFMAAAAVSAGLAADPPRTLVICSPGSPGNTLQAEQTMEVFAETVAAAAGRPADSLTAVYHETAEAGLAHLAKDDAALAMVPLPFLVRYGSELSLKPRLEAIQADGRLQTWSLVAKKGSVASPAALAGWEITGAPGYSEAFVRGVMLAGWGRLPADAKITFNARPLGALRRAATGEKVAVMLDRAGTTSLATLPFAADLEVVAESKPLPGGFLCTVGNRMPAAEADKLVASMEHMHERPGVPDVLKMMTLTRFAPVDQKALDQVLRSAAASK